jgi:hypothetical protein
MTGRGWASGALAASIRRTRRFTTPSRPPKRNPCHSWDWYCLKFIGIFGDYSYDFFLLVDGFYTLSRVSALDVFTLWFLLTFGCLTLRVYYVDEFRVNCPLLTRSWTLMNILVLVISESCHLFTILACWCTALDQKMYIFQRVKLSMVYISKANLIMSIYLAEISLHDIRKMSMH